MSNTDTKRFAVALSFPGEYRSFVENIANHLADEVSKNRVLYDKFWEAEFAQLDLDNYLPNLYRNQSELVVIFLCPEYKQKRWCKLEWRHIKQLIATPDQHKIMLMSFIDPDDLTDIGILPGDGYINIGSRKPDEIAALILQRHSLHYPQSKIAAPLNQQDKSTPEIKQEKPFYGKQRADLLNFFVSDWLVNGPAVAMLQGFPGCGKTQLASEIAVRSSCSLDPIEPQLESQDASLDLLRDLALALADEGFNDLMLELEKGAEGNLFNALLRVLRRDRILIVIDEFQRLLDTKDTLPPKGWQSLVESLNNSHSPAGRLLILSNRSIKNARWCEKSASRELKGLTDSEAAGFLKAFLSSKDLSEKIPKDRLEEIGHRLGGNPRALKTLVESLKYFSLDELISLAPDLFKPGDVKLNPDLVEDFERELIERTLSCMEGELLKFMRWLSVYRRPFNRDASVEITTVSTSPQSLRKELIDRFLLETTISGETLHPLAREISVTRLREDKNEWRQAHSLAADCYFKYFKNLQPRETRKLTSSYAELRHHLFEAARMDELYLASDKLTKFALSLLPRPAQSKIPDNLETLEEHIALISSLPEMKRPKGLEYHLALCLKQRNTADDYRKALFHVRRATGPHAYYAVWLLLLDLEYALNGVDAMLRAQKEAIRILGSGHNAFSVYHHCAHILRKNNRFDDAIELLETATATPGIACVSSLMSLQARCMEETGRYEDAFNVLKKGIVIPNIQELGTIYLHCAGLLARQNRLAEAISFLKDGLKFPGMTKYYSIYLLIAEYQVKLGEDDEAINILKQGMSDTRVLDPKDMYCVCANLLVKHHRVDEAAKLLEKGIESKTVKESVPLYHSYVGIMEKGGDAAGGIKFLKKAMKNPRLVREPSLYFTCAKLLAHDKKLDEAIEVLNQGLSVPGIKLKNHFYQMKAEMTTWQGRLDEAIEILKLGIAGSDFQHLDFLYKHCSELLVKVDRLEDAITLLKTAINLPGLRNKGILYQLCAKLLAMAGRVVEGITLLEKAIRLPGTPGKINLYQTCTDLMTSVGRNKDAINLINSALNGPRMGNLASLITRCADLLVTEGRREEAVSLLKKGIADYPGDGQLKNALDKIINPEQTDA